VLEPADRLLGLLYQRPKHRICAAEFSLRALDIGGLGVKAPANCRLIGRWRIVESDLWDRAHLDLCGPATLTISAQGGEIAFGALQAILEVEYARDSIGFRWNGCEEGDQVEGEGTAELLDDDSIEIEFAYHNGDEAVLKAKRVTSSTAC
jgi:hypothetical protein